MAVGYKHLCTAIAQNDDETFQSLVHSSPELVSHWKPLCDAAFLGKPQYVEALLQAGANPNQRAGTASRHTPLTRITQYHKTIPRHSGHLRCLQILLAHDADPLRVGGPFSWAPIVYATVGPNVDFIELLRPYAKSDLFTASALHDLVQIKCLLNRQPAITVDSQRYSPLHYLSISGVWRQKGTDRTLDCARVLLNAGACVDVVYDFPEGTEIFDATPLWFAVAQSENDVLTEFLLASGADPNVPVFAATYRGEIAVLELLHRYGANWNQTFEGNTPIMELFRYRRTKVVPWLLAHGARATDTDKKQRSLMHLAAIYGAKVSILNALVSHGVDVSAPDAEGVTPFEYAQQHSRKEVVRFLECLS